MNSFHPCRETVPWWRNVSAGAKPHRGMAPGTTLSLSDRGVLAFALTEQGDQSCSSASVLVNRKLADLQVSLLYNEAREKTEWPGEVTVFIRVVKWV